MRTLYQTFGRVAVVMVLVLCTTFAWAQSTDTKVIYNAAGTPVIMPADAPMPVSKSGQPLGTERNQSGAAAAATNQTLTPEAAEALKTRPAVVVNANGEARFETGVIAAWENDFRNWMEHTPGAKASLTAEEYDMVANNQFADLYKHLYLTSSPDALKRSQAVK